MAHEHKFKSILPAKEHHETKKYFDSRDEYETELLKLQMKLLHLQHKMHRHGQKVIVLFEGADAAGKGGAISRLTMRLDSRGFSVHSIGKPNSVEKGQHYFERFFNSLPSPGILSIFDRSWYGRVLVERVEGFCTHEAWKRAYAEINAVEKMWSDDGMLVLKYFLDITYDEQKERFKERQKDPFKKWKLTEEDFRNRKKWPAYYEAFNDMLQKTSTPECPWKVISADSKWYCRVMVLKDIAKRLKEKIKDDGE